MHHVCRIADALLALQSAGHAQYITWSYSFHCEFDVYSTLDNQAKQMENELEKWKDEIAKSRDTFHVLNLFTTQQLRVIRQQLGQLNCERISSLPPAVISMLMSISPKICEKDIKECLHFKNKKSYKNKDPKVVLNEIQGLNSQNNKSIENGQNGHIENDASPVVEPQHDMVYLMEQRLIENGISSCLAREAAKHSPNNIEIALRYCLKARSRSTKQSFLQVPSTDRSR